MTRYFNILAAAELSMLMQQDRAWRLPGFAWNREKRMQEAYRYAPNLWSPRREALKRLAKIFDGAVPQSGGRPPKPRSNTAKPVKELSPLQAALKALKRKKAA